MGRKYDAVFLDAQGTLLKAKPAVSAIYAGVYRRFGGDASEAAIAAAMKKQWTEYRSSVGSAVASFDTSEEITRQWWASFNRSMFRRLGMWDGTDEFLDGLWEEFGRPENWELFPDVAEVLIELRGRGYRLGIVSNWDSRLITISMSLGLGSMTDFIIASAAAGMEKPDRRIFDLALTRAGTTAGRALHVGDDYEADILGARAAGVDAVLIDRDGDAVRPVQTIRSFSELLTILP